MSTPQHLNTTVKGSVGMLQEAERALYIGKRWAEDADENHHAARDIAHANWRGEGGAAFLEDLKPHLNNTRDLAATCDAYARAFGDLAGTLQVVKDDMERVRSTALAGGLQVQGPIVMRPQSPGPGPNTSDFVGDSAGYHKVAMAHQAVVDEFNAKAQVFNNCLAIFTDARNKEKQGHIEFWEAVDAGEGFGLDGAWNIGTSTASAALGGLAGMHNTRADLLTKLEHLEPHSQAYQKLASGTTTLRGLTAAQRMQIMHDMARTKASEVNYRRQLTQLDKISKYVPESFQHFAAANPSDIKANSKLGQQVGKAFRRLPWAGSAITVVSEFKGAATGEQTWAKAVVDTGAKLGGGALGGAAGVAVCAPVLPPVGPIVCGAGGAILGSVAGDKVTDFIVPEQTGMPQPVSPVADEPNRPPRGAR